MAMAHNQAAPSLITKFTKVQLAFGTGNWTAFVKDHPVVKYREKDWSSLCRDFLRAYEDWLQAVALDEELDGHGNAISKSGDVIDKTETSMMLYSPPRHTPPRQSPVMP